MRGPGVSCCATRGPSASPCTCAVRSAGAGVPASFGAGTGATAVRSAGADVPASFGADFGSGGSSDAYTGVVVAAIYTGAAAASASADSLSSRAGGVPSARRPSGSSEYPSHDDSADGVSGRDSLRH